MRIGARFCGPPDSGNGGYTAGLLASEMAGVVEVTLRAPPPLERELGVVPRQDGFDLLDDSRLIAEARPAQLTRHPLDVPSFAAACEASMDYVGFREHYFPNCFVCGPARPPGDGLRIFPAALSDQLVAAPWQPDPSLSTLGSGELPAELMWAALDCIGYFAIAQPLYPMALLGRMTAEIFAKASVGERYVVVGAPLAREGRKLFARTAVYTAAGELCGHAHQTWIALSRSSSSYPPPSSRRMPVAAPENGDDQVARDVLAEVIARVPRG